MEKNQLFLSGRKGKALGLNPPVACGDSPPSSGALGNTHKVSRYAKGPPISGGWHAERDWGVLSRQNHLKNLMNF